MGRKYRLYFIKDTPHFQEVWFRPDFIKNPKTKKGKINVTIFLAYSFISLAVKNPN